MNDQNTATENRLNTATHHVKHPCDQCRVDLQSKKQPKQSQVGDEKMIDRGNETGACLR